MFIVADLVSLKVSRGTTIFNTDGYQYQHLCLLVRYWYL